MGKKRAASQTVARKQTDKAVKLYEELTSLNDQLLTGKIEYGVKCHSLTVNVWVSLSQWA